MPRRLPSASTTLETALTIPVNIYVPRDQQIVAKPGRIELAKDDCFGQVLDAGAAEGTGRFAPSDEPRRDVSVNLVHQALREEACVHLAAAFHQEAEDAPFAELVQQWFQRHATVGGGGQLEDLGCS